MYTQYILWIDDLCKPEEYLGERYDRPLDCVVVWAKNVQEAINCVNQFGFPSYMFLDHDLGPQEDVMAFLKWLFETYPEPSISIAYTVISSNPEGRKNIISYLESWKRSLLL